MALSAAARNFYALALSGLVTHASASCVLPGSSTEGYDTSYCYAEPVTATCSSDGGTFAFDGCQQVPKCDLPLDTTGYDTAGCPATPSNMLNNDECVVSCDANHTGSPMAICTSDGGRFSFSGCTAKPTCDLPEDITGYDTTSCAAAPSAKLHVDQCTLSCAPNYAGAAMATCDSDGGRFTFSGCERACKFPQEVYNTAACPSESSSSQCTVTCGWGYFGTASDSCAGPGAPHVFSGCNPKPLCDLPADSTGYDTTGCAAAPSAMLRDDQCTLRCATHFTGSATATCDSDGGFFKFSGCEPACALPTTAYHTHGCADPSSSSQCTVSCATGFTGTATDSCPTPGGVHVFGGCVAKPTCDLPTDTTGYTTFWGCQATSMARLRDDQCNVGCDGGYVGSATATCASEGGRFSFSGCEPACSLPSDTTGYSTSSCSGWKSSTQCTVTCDTGYTGTATDSCTTPGGQHVLAGCTAIPTCKLPGDTTGYDITTCNATSTNMLREDQCVLSCATNYTGSPTDTCASNGGRFTLSGCAIIPACELPADTAGYDITACNATSTNMLREDGCTLSCATNYTGSPTDTCASYGGRFSFSGCEPTCSLPSSTTGYNTAGCPEPSSSAACSLSCDTAYTGTPTATCSTAGGTHVLAGCSAKPTCNLPTVYTGYITTSCAASAPSNLLRDDECTLSCDVNYTGSATDTCAGGRFTFSGCEPECTLPSDTTGYVTSLCSGTQSSSGCTVSCAPLYTGTATASCTTPGGTHMLSGCTAMPTCKLPAVTTGYDTSACLANSTNLLREDECTLSCAADYAGSPTATCASNGGRFTFSGCDPACVLPTTPYNTGSCGSTSSSSDCTVTCAVGYEGTATDSCPAPGGVHALAGCVAMPVCDLPADTTGYNTGGCPATSSNMLREDQCTLSCDTTYMGSTPAATCASDGGRFTFSGCTAKPTCKKPADTSGYDTASCDANSTNMLRDDECVLSCATNYSGSGSASCASNGGRFTFSGCEPACTLPPTTPGYSTGWCTGMKSSSGCTVTCDTGYEGTPTDTCTTPGGTHILAGCTAKPKCKLPADHSGYDNTSCDATSTNTLRDDQCAPACADNYTGSASASCATDNGTFTFSGCEPMCTLPSSTTGYSTGGCTGMKSSSACTVTCAASYTGTPTDTCTAPGGTHELAGCTEMPTCDLPADTTGYDTADCPANSSSKLRDDQCTLSCATNYAGSPTATCASAGGRFTFSGCDPACKLPSAVYHGDCWGMKSSSQCTLTCASDYAGTATDSCSAPGAAHTLAGCTVKPTCDLPADTTGYVTTSCGATPSNKLRDDQCYVSCAANYEGTPEVTCSSGGGRFIFSGCTPKPKCDLPADTTGYKTTNCAATSSNKKRADQCSLSCATNYRGSPSASCETDGGRFTFIGCDPACTLPSDTAGYSTGGCTGTKSSSQCSVTCAAGYTGTEATDTCTTPGGKHELAGCTAKPKCDLPTDTTGYKTTSCAATSSSKLRDDQCFLSCATDYAGSPTATCTSNGGRFKFSGCEPACTLPSNTTGYNTAGCTGTKSSSQCTVTCATEYTGTATDNCATPGGEHTLDGCTALPKCKLPDSMPGYVTSGCAATASSMLSADQCVVSCAANFSGGPLSVNRCPVLCASGYSGTPSLGCDSGTFTFDGCSKPTTNKAAKGGENGKKDKIQDGVADGAVHAAELTLLPGLFLVGLLVARAS